MTVRPISIIVCTHNRADLLPRVIGQLRAQDYPADAFEIIVVDNGSTDHTPQVVERFVTEPGVPVRYVAESRLGVTLARNRGAEEAGYPYLAYLDDDCSVEPDWLSQLVSGFDLDERVVIVAGRIIVDFDKQEKPTWLGPKSERWLGAYSYPGSQSRLLEYPLYVCEGNMTLTRGAWKAVGGFLGIDQFGSPHVAAQEIRYLLKQIERQGGKVAFVPSAFVHHHSGIPTRRWMLRRAYLHGVSDGILDYFLHRRSWVSVAYRAILDTAAMIIFFGYSAFFFLKIDEATGMYHLLRAIARLGKILSEMRLVGDWPRVWSWAAVHHQHIEYRPDYSHESGER
jgi:glycosyltransferase involved in cell wall biosynthesis